MADEPSIPPAKPFLVGYTRVSTADQDAQRQKDELIRYGVHPDDIWTDKASGRDMKRPGWQGLWKDIRAGDVVVVLSMDRLGRDVMQILQTVEAMKARGVGLKLLTGEVDTDTPIGRFVFTVMAGFAQLERDLINERTAHGLKQARERGVIGGRPQKITEAMVLDAIALGGLTAASNLSDVPNASTARVNLGLGGAAVLGVGTTTGTVADGGALTTEAALARSAANLTSGLVPVARLVNRATITPITTTVGTTATTIYPAGAYISIRIALTAAGTVACTGDGTTPALGGSGTAAYGQDIRWPFLAGGAMPAGAIQCIAAATSTITTEAH
jgi:DNA invertase Pin-like site-specific DNA recombinase